ncbi:IclR family transcriptional regulator [Sphingobium sp. YR768]|jgi:DNA-binding IclR family transcriptional regulator|uniref:IclR family transcriptional regulator n=1 Tax=Sphingobium sp. YR768 TaxID=1884365 RepID=UPI0008D3E3D9|nr:IclR family transcriptional regulator [Sphingobium sp. YR768]SES19252.1 transcriptional regulator, IclR family [Sphingobium sp. YR768]
MVEDRSGVKSLNLALDVIEAVAAASEDIGVTELASRLGLTKATVFRHLQTLVERNYLAQDSRTTRYRLGLQCQLLAQLGSNQVDLHSASEEAAHWLRDQTGLSVAVSTVRARSVVVLSMVAAPTPVQIGVRPGSSLSLHSSAQGRVALAFGSSALQNFARKQEFAASTDHTLTGWDRLEAHIAQVRVQGWSDAPEQLALGLNAVAAPIFNGNDECIGTIAVVGLIQDLPRTPHPQVTHAVMVAASRVSTILGYQKP